MFSPYQTLQQQREYQNKAFTMSKGGSNHSNCGLFFKVFVPSCNRIIGVSCNKKALLGLAHLHRIVEEKLFSYQI